MSEERKVKYRKLLSLAVKISIGSSLAIWIATLLELQFATSAGIITLLSIVTTKLETFKLSMIRIVTFLISVAICWIIFQHMSNEWIAYGIFIFLIVVLCEGIGWRSTLSVNAVIGTHFLTTHDFSYQFVWNEFLLVVIGIVIAMILNSFHDYAGHRDRIISYVNDIEVQMQEVIQKLANYLANPNLKNHVWDDVIALEQKLEFYIQSANEYENNSFQKHTDYYARYFEMRSKQCGILHNLHYELKRIRTVPMQAKYIAEFILLLKDYIVQSVDPEDLIVHLHGISDALYKEDLPKSAEEFEKRALLYHIVMDLEDFLIYNRRFLHSIKDEKYLKYWKIK